MIPEGDLAHIRHENEGYCATETLLLISTPRSGSTMLSTDIDVLYGGPMAEYCQPYQIIPYLMKLRPHIRSGEKLSLPAYAEYLKNFRSGKSQKLCINIHTSHIKIWKLLHPYLPPVTKAFILVRRDIINQAISFYIASKTGIWSSSYGKINHSLPFDPSEITQKIVAIYQGVKQNINEFATTSDVIFYEDYVKNNWSFAAMNNLKSASDSSVITKKQATDLNAHLARTYAEYITHSDNEEISHLIKNYSKLIGDVTTLRLGGPSRSGDRY
jgi:LPS sulfotransferase NodH